MSNDKQISEIDAVDSFALDLFRRAKQSGLDFQDIAALVRRIHTVLKHLRAEAADPDSLLNSDKADVYTRRITPVVQDCEFTFQQLDTILEKYGVDSDGSQRSNLMGKQERDKLGIIRDDLEQQKTKIDLFLDTVQLKNPSRTRQVVENTNEGDLDAIKDKVDAIATRLFSRRDSGFCEDDDDLWRQFREELEREGFSKDVLGKNKEVLRAYIRELESTGIPEGGQPPSVRGLLEQARPYPDDNYLGIIPMPYPPSSMADRSPKELMCEKIDNEKFAPSVKHARRMPEEQPAALVHHRYRYDQTSSDEDAESSDPIPQLAFISTRDLMFIDNLSLPMSNMHLSPNDMHYGVSPGTSPSNRYLPPAGTAIGALPAPHILELSNSPASQALSISPGQAPPPPYSPPRAARLAPDRYGQEIPLDAEWTKIKRSLVSPEVLQRAGVRYEARPDFVAVLGRLTRKEIAMFAQLSAECRASRSSQMPQYTSDRPKYRDETDSGSSERSYEDDTTDDEKRHDDGKGTRSYPVIVNPPEKSASSPSSTVQPKPILKNKNANRVRFDLDPHELSPDDGKSPRSSREMDRDKDRNRRRSTRDRDRDHDRDSHRERDRDRDRNRDRRDRDRDRDRDDYRRRHGRSDKDRNRDRDRDERSRREERQNKKKAWGETLGAVGIGGAAASLLSVLTEAASAL